MYPSSWTHALSKGNRTGTITFSTNATLHGGAFSILLDGTFNAGGPYGQGTNVGQYYKFDLTNSYTIDGFKVFLTGLTTLETNRIGYFDFEGSADNSTWVSLTTGFIWGDTTSPNGTNLQAQTSDSDLSETFPSVSIQTKLFTNTVAYRYYRFMGTSGNWNDNPYYCEICFKVG